MLADSSAMTSRELPAASPVPLLIGVTGHRDLKPSELPNIVQLVETFLRTLQSDFPELPLCILNALAEGADTLVANVAHRLEIDVVNVLPMPRANYEQDFSGAALTEFRRLHDLSPTIELPLLLDDASCEAPRGLHYEQLGVFLAAHSHLLLALWDGVPNGALGGTSQVVNFHMNDATALADAAQQRSRLDVSDDESDLVYHIVCGRQSTPHPERNHAAGSAFWLTRDEREQAQQVLPARYRAVFTQMTTLNQDCQLVAKHSAERFERLEPDLVQESPGTLDRIQQLFGVCDSLASHFQKRMLLALRATLLFALAAGLAFIAYADFSDLPQMIWVYLLCAGLSVSSFVWAGAAQWHRKHLDYRVLAEALRVQYYWALAGVPMVNPSRYSHDSFFRGRELDLGWIRNVMRYTGLHPPPDVSDEQLDVAIRSWVGDEQGGQLGYYARRSREKLAQLRATERLTLWCFGGGLMVALVLALFAHLLPNAGTNVLVALMGLMPLIAAGRQSYSHRLAERELVAQYAHMREIFNHAGLLLKNTSDSAGKRKLLRELGESALHENARWLLRQRNRPLPGGDAMS